MGFFLYLCLTPKIQTFKVNKWQWSWTLARPTKKIPIWVFFVAEADFTRVRRRFLKIVCIVDFFIIEILFLILGTSIFFIFVLNVDSVLDSSYFQGLATFELVTFWLIVIVFERPDNKKNLLYFGNFLVFEGDWWRKKKVLELVRLVKQEFELFILSAYLKAA